MWLAGTAWEGALGQKELGASGFLGQGKASSLTVAATHANGTYRSRGWNAPSRATEAFCTFCLPALQGLSASTHKRARETP